jgi:hypothetical protein
MISWRIKIKKVLLFNEIIIGFIYHIVYIKAVAQHANLLINKSHNVNLKKVYETFQALLAS